MINGEFTITFEEGLHARPASELVRVCQKAKSDIKIKKGEMTTDPKSILGIMAMEAAKGDTLEVEISGEDEEEVFSNMKAFFEGK